MVTGVKTQRSEAREKMKFSPLLLKMSDDRYKRKKNRVIDVLFRKNDERNFSRLTFIGKGAMFIFL